MAPVKVGPWPITQSWAGEIWKDKRSISRHRASELQDDVGAKLQVRLMPPSPC